MASRAPCDGEWIAGRGEERARKELRPSQRIMIHDGPWHRAHLVALGSTAILMGNGSRFGRGRRARAQRSQTLAAHHDFRERSCRDLPSRARHSQGAPFNPLQTPLKARSSGRIMIAHTSATKVENLDSVIFVSLRASFKCPVNRSRCAR